MKESFVFFETWAEAIRQMPDKERLQVYDAIMAYGIYNTKTNVGGLAQMALTMVYNDIDDCKAKRAERAEKARNSANKRWQNTNTNVCERIQTQPNAHERMQQNATQCYNVNDNVNVNVNDNSIVLGANNNADKSATQKQPAKTIDERRNDFMFKIADVGKGVYPDNMLRAFFDYWSESNENGRKMLFEMKKTFDVKKRLAKWAERDNNNFKKFNNGNDGNSTIAERAARIADYAFAANGL